MTESPARRYKGTSPFADLELDRRIFFGRERESRSLLSLVLAENLVVLFAKSGVGKTSLLNAGLLEPLREKGYFPMMARVNDQKAGPLESMFRSIHQALFAAQVECVHGDERSAWLFFKKAEFWSQTQDLLRPVLILDQFEELFTLHLPKPRREFIAELATLVKGVPPRKPVDASDGVPDAGPPDLKIVLSLREDFLANLEDLSTAIPGVLHNRFRLGPLGREGAREAIIGPAQLVHEGLHTEPFAYKKAAVEEIITFLGKRRLGEDIVETDAIEPVQLQLICQHVEEEVRERQRTERARIEFSELDLGGEKKMREVLEGFYDRTLASIQSRREARRVRRLCEDRLISRGGRRLTEDEEEIERNFDISKDRLRQLVDARLLRAEPRLGGVFYELSHDTLVEPIRRSRQKRRTTRNRWLLGTVLAAVLGGLVLLAYYASSSRDQLAKLRLGFAIQTLAQMQGDERKVTDWILERQKEGTSVATVFEEGPGLLPETVRNETLLQAVTALTPVLSKRLENDFDATVPDLAVVFWVLDAFPLRDRDLADRAREARQRLERALRARRPDPGEIAPTEWVMIPGGVFKMGSEKGEGDPSELPVHQVEVSAFRMLSHEVTNQEFGGLFEKWATGVNPTLPAVDMSWYQAYVFAAWKGGRLPTEAEWEYAARSGGKERIYPWSDAPPTCQNDLAVIDFCFGDGPLPVCFKPKGNTDQGLCDMAGNAWEWVADWFGGYPTEKQNDPWGPVSGGDRVIRGGGFYDPADWARASTRDWTVPRIRFRNLGFRVVLPAAPQP